VVKIIAIQEFNAEKCILKSRFVADDGIFRGKLQKSWYRDDHINAYRIIVFVDLQVCFSLISLSSEKIPFFRDISYLSHQSPHTMNCKMIWSYIPICPKIAKMNKVHQKMDHINVEFDWFLEWVENATHIRKTFPHRTITGRAISPNVGIATFGTPFS
jgi:hypothetical protein